MTDVELIHRFAGENDEDAFREIVSRHIPLVYSSALRQAGNPSLAEDICQSVFIILARKAADLDERTILSGWLYRTTRFTTLRALKAERRRESRERDAMTTHLNEGDENEPWTQLAPRLDEAMATLNEKDRNALILRFFENRKLNEVGARLGLSEDAAQKRVSRALEKIRRFFTRRAIPISAGALTTALSTKAVASVPAQATAAAASVALIQGAAAPLATLTLVKGTLNAMAWTKLKTTAAAAAAAAILVTATPAIIQSKTNARQRDEVQSLTETNRDLAALGGDTAEIERLRRENEELERLRNLAEEVHELRAKLGEYIRLEKARTVKSTELASQNTALRERMNRLNTAPQIPTEVTLDDEEQDRMRIRLIRMKKFGLAFYQSISRNDGALPARLEDFLDELEFDNAEKGQLLNQFRYFSHGSLDQIADRGRTVILAERTPSKTRDGKLVWAYTIADGSSHISAVPVPANGIFPPDTRL